LIQHPFPAWHDVNVFPSHVQSAFCLVRDDEQVVASDSMTGVHQFFDFSIKNVMFHSFDETSKKLSFFQ
jgi:hypothetical protein